MSTTYTPETDALIEGNGYHPTEHMWREHARKLERERDEMKQSLEGLFEAIGIPVDYEDNLEAMELIQVWQKGHLECAEARAENQRLGEALNETAECLACWAGDSRSNEATRVVLRRAKAALASGKGGAE